MNPINIKVCKLHGNNCDMRCVDPNVDNGMMTKVWGPTGWLFLHCVTFGYPYAINDGNFDHAYKKEHYKRFFMSIGNILPCKYCRESYKEFVKKVPIDNYLNTRRDLCLWLYKIHNMVNRKLGVPEEDIPRFSEIQTFYEQFRAKCKKTSEEEREANKEKGCVKPADGTPKKCIINVVACKEGDVTRRENSIVYKSNNLKKSFEGLFEFKNWVLPSIIISLIYFIIYRFSIVNTIQKLLN